MSTQLSGSVINKYVIWVAWAANRGATRNTGTDAEKFMQLLSSSPARSLATENHSSTFFCNLDYT